MTRLRAWLASVIAPCRCEVTYSEGNALRWRIIDASGCQHYGHSDDTTCVGLRP